MAAKVPMMSSCSTIPPFDDAVYLTGGMVTPSWSIPPDPSPGLLFDTTNERLRRCNTGPEQNHVRDYIQRCWFHYGLCQRHSRGLVPQHVITVVPLEQLEMVALEPELVITGSTFEIEPDLPEACSSGLRTGDLGNTDRLMDLTNFTIYANSSLFNDEFAIQIGVLVTDLDGH